MRRQPETRRFLRRLEPFLAYMLPRYHAGGEELPDDRDRLHGRPASLGDDGERAGAAAEEPQGYVVRVRHRDVKQGTTVMIGIVVVTHGKLARELVKAARKIVGEHPGTAAVSIGWGDDAGGGDARRWSGRWRRSAASEVLLLTDMFGGTPTNLSLPFLSQRIEIVTGRRTCRC